MPGTEGSHRSPTVGSYSRRQPSPDGPFRGVVAFSTWQRGDRCSYHGDQSNERNEHRFHVEHVVRERIRPLRRLSGAIGDSPEPEEATQPLSRPSPPPAVKTTRMATPKALKTPNALQRVVIRSIFVATLPGLPKS